MKLEPFPQTYRRERNHFKRPGFYRELSLGLDGYAKVCTGTESHDPTSGEERGNIDMYHLPVASYTHVFGKAKYNVVPEILNLFSLLSQVPRRPRSTPKYYGSSVVMSEGSSGADLIKESPCATSSEMPPCANRKGRKRKTKKKEESSDSEVTVSRRIRLRGQAGRTPNCGRTITNERGMLDSGLFSRYFKHIWDSFSEEKVNSVACLDPLWFCVYENKRSRDDNDLTWLKKMSLLSKKYVLVPIVMWSHWSLLIFCHLGESLSSKTSTPCMVLLDSLHGIGPNRLESLIRRLLLDLYKAEERPEDNKQLMAIPFLTPMVPQQRNGEECGFYVLHYINLFLESAPENFSVSEGYPYFMKQDWFTSEAMDSFYKRLDGFPIGSSDNDSNRAPKKN